MTITKILVPVDPSGCSDTALKTAATLAIAYKAELFVHHVEESSASPAEIKSKALAILGSAAHTYSQSSGNVYREILNRAAAVQANLIVMGTHGNSGFQEFWMGTNAYKVVSSAKCPVLTLRDGEQPTFKKIVAPMDTSFETRQKIPVIIDFAKNIGAAVHLIGVSTGNDKEAEHQVNSYLRQACDSITDHGITCVVENRLGGNITNTAIAYSKEIGADLIVIMSEQEPQIGSFFLGKFAQQMVNHSPVAVLTVPTREDLMITDARL
jgi:nucleotide-binding universal stress UspA family protein